jgi:hypothetical protein
LTEAMGILTSLFFGGVAYIIFGFWQEKEFIKNQIKYIKQQREQQREVKQKQKEAEIEFYKRWKRLEVQDRWTKKK